MKIKSFQLIFIGAISLSLIACANKSTQQIGHNTFTTSAEQRIDALEEANYTCQEMDKQLKVTKERIQKERIIIDYGCFNKKEKAYLESSEYKIEKK